MTAGPKGVAGKVSLPEQRPETDPLCNYCPDLDQWPSTWAYELNDIPAGLRMVEYFKPFLRSMLAEQLSRSTLRRHRDNTWLLGGEVIRRMQMDNGLRERPVEQVVLSLIDGEGGPLLSHHGTEAEQRSFDATCRRLFRFATGPETVATFEAAIWGEPTAPLTASRQTSRRTLAFHPRASLPVSAAGVSSSGSPELRRADPSRPI